MKNLKTFEEFDIGKINPFKKTEIDPVFHKKITIKSFKDPSVVIKIFFDENGKIIKIDNKFFKKYPFPPLRDAWGPWVGYVVDEEEIKKFLNWKYKNDLYIVDN